MATLPAQATLPICVIWKAWVWWSWGEPGLARPLEGKDLSYSQPPTLTRDQQTSWKLIQGDIRMP